MVQAEALGFCFLLRSFCFPHGHHISRGLGAYLSACGHIRILFAHARLGARIGTTNRAKGSITAEIRVGQPGRF
jgi:hypothetical protein